VIDVETTGLSTRQDRILELAIVRTDEQLRVLDEWVCRFNPGRPVGAVHIHGITDADIANAPPFASVVADICTRLGGAAIVGHNVNFDLAFLRAEYTRSGWQLPYLPALCTFQLASTRHLSELPRHRLGDCCAAVGIGVEKAHSALHDARATYELLCAFVNPPRGVPLLPAELKLSADALSISWPTGPTSTPREPPASHSPRRPLSDQALRQIARTAAAGPQPALRSLLNEVRLADALDDGATEGSLPYLALLAEALEDGVLTAAEQDALHEIAAAYELGALEVAAAHRGFVLALAYLALDDGKVSRNEKFELTMVSELLDVDKKILESLLKVAEAAREARLSAGLLPLPADWPYDEPLRVGDRVVFTGCDPDERERLEGRAEQLGVRVLGAVSGRTTVLVTDGDFSGTKTADAAALGTRVVTPTEFDVLLQHLQPALSRAERTKVRPRVVAASSAASDPEAVALLTREPDLVEQTPSHEHPNASTQHPTAEAAPGLPPSTGTTTPAARPQPAVTPHFPRRTGTRTQAADLNSGIGTERRGRCTCTPKGNKAWTVDGL
jgi:DNA polymerase-3 subunit epsilon